MNARAGSSVNRSTAAAASPRVGPAASAPSAARCSTAATTGWVSTKDWVLRSGGWTRSRNRSTCRAIMVPSESSAFSNRPSRPGRRATGRGFFGPLPAASLCSSALSVPKSRNIQISSGSSAASTPAIRPCAWLDSSPDTIALMSAKSAEARKVPTESTIRPTITAWPAPGTSSTRSIARVPMSDIAWRRFSIDFWKALSSTARQMSSRTVASRASTMVGRWI